MESAGRALSSGLPNEAVIRTRPVGMEADNPDAARILGRAGGVSGLSHLGGETRFLIEHALALCRCMRVLIAVCMAIKLATGCRHGLVGLGCFSILLTCRVLGLAFLLALLQILVLVLQHRIGALELNQGHGECRSCFVVWVAG